MSQTFKQFLVEGTDWRGASILPKGSTVTVVKKGHNFDGKTGKVVSVNTATRGMPKGKPMVAYGVEIDGEVNFFNSDQLKGTQSFTQKIPDKKHFKESAKPEARWQKTSGPNRVGGYELQTPSDSGGYKGLGFVMTNSQPNTHGKISLYKGSTGKDVMINLDDYQFSQKQIDLDPTNLKESASLSPKSAVKQAYGIVAKEFGIPSHREVKMYKHKDSLKLDWALKDLSTQDFNKFISKLRKEMKARGFRIEVEPRITKHIKKYNEIPSHLELTYTKL